MAGCRANMTLASDGLLNCSRHQGHQGLHLDGEYQLWWASHDSRAVGATGLTVTGDGTGTMAALADVVGGFSEDIAGEHGSAAAYASDLLERLATRIREHADDKPGPAPVDFTTLPAEVQELLRSRRQAAAAGPDPLRRLAGIITSVIGPMHPSNGTDALEAIASAIQAGE